MIWSRVGRKAEYWVFWVRLELAGSLGGSNGVNWVDFKDSTW